MGADRPFCKGAKSRRDVAVPECSIRRRKMVGGGEGHSRVALRGDKRDPGPHRRIGLEGAHDHDDEGPKTKIQTEETQAVQVRGRGLGGDGHGGGRLDLRGYSGAVHFGFHPLAR